MLAAIHLESVGLLFTSLFFVVSGFSFITPALNSLISRRSDPAQQGRILGVSQSVNSLARILGPLVGNILLVKHLSAPYLVALVLILVGGAWCSSPDRRGKILRRGMICKMIPSGNPLGCGVANARSP